MRGHRRGERWQKPGVDKAESSDDVYEHAKRGGFLPPIPLPRRMWAGSRIVFNDDIRVGDLLKRRSVIHSITQKDGVSGSLVPSLLL